MFNCGYFSKLIPLTSNLQLVFVTTSAKSYGYTCWQLWLLSNAEIKQTKFDYMMITTYIIYSQCRLLFFFHKNRVTVSLRLVKLRKSLLVSDGKILGKSFFMCLKTDISMWRLDVIRIRLTPPVFKTWKKKHFKNAFTLESSKAIAQCLE